MALSWLKMSVLEWRINKTLTTFQAILTLFKLISKESF